MRLSVHIIQHESFESPAAILTWIQEQGHLLSYSRVYQGESLPKNADHFDFLIVMGGPQSPSTTKVACPHFDVKAEVALIQDAIKQKRLVLGVCLGAQLIGEAYGYAYEHSPNREIGVFDVTMTAAAEQDPIFKHFSHTWPVGHWHGDMPGIGPNGVILAQSEGCPRQIVRYAPNVYGFQCHMEFTPEAIEGMIAHCSHELKEYANLPFIQNSVVLRSQNYSGMNQKLFQFLDQFCHFGLSFESKENGHKCQ